MMDIFGYSWPLGKSKSCISGSLAPAEGQKSFKFVSLYVGFFRRSLFFGGADGYYLAKGANQADRRWLVLAQRADYHLAKSSGRYNHFEADVYKLPQRDAFFLDSVEDVTKLAACSTTVMILKAH